MLNFFLEFVRWGAQFGIDFWIANVGWHCTNVGGVTFSEDAILNLTEVCRSVEKRWSRFLLAQVKASAQLLNLRCRGGYLSFHPADGQESAWLLASCIGSLVQKLRRFLWVFTGDCIYSHWHQNVPSDITSRTWTQYRCQASKIIFYWIKTWFPARIIGRLLRAILTSHCRSWMYNGARAFTDLAQRRLLRQKTLNGFFKCLDERVKSQIYAFKCQLDEPFVM